MPRKRDEEEIKYAIDNNCFSLEMRGHLGSLPMPGDRPQQIAIKKAAAQYATDVSGSENDYLVLDITGEFAFYDGLVAAGSPADQKIDDLTGTGKKVIEAKYGYPTLNKFIKPESQLPAGFERDINLTYNGGEKTDNEKNQYRQMRDELRREAVVARNCLLNYAVIYNNKTAELAARELFTFPQTKVITPGVKTHHIALSDLR